MSIIHSTTKLFADVDVVKLKSELELLNSNYRVQSIYATGTLTSVEIETLSGSVDANAVQSAINSHVSAQKKRVVVDDQPTEDDEAANKEYVDAVDVVLDSRLDTAEANIESLQNSVINQFSTSLPVSSGQLNIDLAASSVVLGALAASVTKFAFVNVPVDNNKVHSVSVVLQGNSAFTYGSACSINGVDVAEGIRWPADTAPTASSNSDILTFVIIRDAAGAVRVFGTATVNFI